MKRVLLKLSIALAFIATIISIVVLSLGFTTKNEIMKLVGTIFTFISPTTFIGIVIKYLMVKAQHINHKRDLEAYLIENGVKLSNNEKNAIESVKSTNLNAFRYSTYTFIRNKDKIIVKFSETGNKVEDFRNFENAFKEYVENERKKQGQ